MLLHLESLWSTLNKFIPSRTKKEWTKEYTEQNKKIIKNKAKEYRKINKELISEKAKEHYQNNKELINERKKVKMTCECGSIIRKADKSTHYKSLKHKKYLKTIEI